MIDTTKFIRKANGRFFTVTFMKKDGTIRTINGRTGVRNSAVETDKYFIVYDLRTKGFRSVRKDSIVRITTDHFTLTNNALSVQ